MAADPAPQGAVTLFLACALTVLIETPILVCAGYRGRDEVTVVVCANVVTNLLLNLSAALLLRGRPWAAYLLEPAVAAAEYGIYALAFGASRRLFWATLAANCISCALGLLAFRA